MVPQVDALAQTMEAELVVTDDMCADVDSVARFSVGLELKTLHVHVEEHLLQSGAENKARSGELQTTDYEFPAILRIGPKVAAVEVG
ncbi:MAG: hypothetical protein Q9188_003386 [Gyalolechia gomerana]